LSERTCRFHLATDAGILVVVWRWCRHGYGHSFIGTAEDVFGALREDPSTFGLERRLAAAIKWFAMQIVSLAKAAAIAGLTREELLRGLARFGVFPFQHDPDEIIHEVDSV